MTSTNGGTALVCLFHHSDQARAALDDLYGARIPGSSISVIGGEDLPRTSGGATLGSLGLPSRDLEHLQQGINAGGAILVVSAMPGEIDDVEHIFGKHRATKIEDAQQTEAEPEAAPLAKPAAPSKQAAETRTIPVIKEEIEIGKKTVDHGGVRVFRRVIEIPAEQSINLREDRVVVHRTAVDRAPTEAELHTTRDSSIELTETAEEVIISKTARVIEEIVVSRETSEHTEHISDTVRRTEVDVRELSAAAAAGQRGA